MNIEDIITLDNDAKYYILDEIEFADRKYYFAVGLYDDLDVDLDDYVFFRYEVNGEDEALIVEDDPQTLTALYVLAAESAVIESDPNGQEYIDSFNQKLQELAEVQQ